MTSDKSPKDPFPKDEDFPDDDFLDSDFDHEDDPSFPDEGHKAPPAAPVAAAKTPAPAAPKTTTPTPAAASTPPKASTPATNASKAPTPAPATTSTTPSKPATPAPAAAAPVPTVPASKTTPIEKEGLASLENMPLTVNVEISRFSMSFKDLTALQKGNLVDLHTPAEAPVNLTVNGKIIGKGELFKIGDTLGVRILEIGK